MRNISSCEKENLKKKFRIERDSNHELCDTGAVPSLLRRGSAEKSECRRKIPWKATAGASARNHAQ